MINPRQRESDLPKGLARIWIPRFVWIQSWYFALLPAIPAVNPAAQLSCWHSHSSLGLGAPRASPPLKWPFCSNHIDALHAGSLSSLSLCSSYSIHLASFSFLLSILEYPGKKFFFLSQISFLHENSLYFNRAYLLLRTMSCFLPYLTARSCY